MFPLKTGDTASKENINYAPIGFPVCVNIDSHLTILNTII